MSSGPVIAVVGADGFVGGGFAEGLGAERIVYGPPRDGEIPVERAREVLQRADVVVNAAGFRVRRGLTLEDYRRCHQGATAALLPFVRPGALFLHMSSAHVLGRSPERPLGNDSPPNPATYPSAAYAQAKAEADAFVEGAAAERGFQAAFLRPTILYARPGDTSLPDNLCKWARRGTLLRLFPRHARHHLCHLDLLVEVARRAIERRDRLPAGAHLVVADPYTVTSRELDALIERHLPRPPRTIPIPARAMNAVLRFSPRSSNPAYDLRTWGDIFGVFFLDTVYDPFPTFRLLGIDAARYAADRTLEPFVRQALA